VVKYKVDKISYIDSNDTGLKTVKNQWWGIFYVTGELQRDRCYDKASDDAWLL